MAELIRVRVQSACVAAGPKSPTNTKKSTLPITVIKTYQYKAKVAICSDNQTKYSMQIERHVEFLNVQPWWYVKKPLGVKRLMLTIGIQCLLKGVPLVALLADMLAYCRHRPNGV
jgi:hypothetical protein